MIANTLTFWSATDMLAALHARDVSARELLDAHVARNEAVRSSVNAVVATDIPAARRRAQAIDDARVRGAELGLLAGIPMTIKDGFDVAGLPAAAGSAGFTGRKPCCPDAEVVAAARGAGAVVWAKTNTPYLCGDFQTYNAVYGTTNNPYDPSRTPSGSSGGAAAALAAGITPLEIGSDSGGSLRHPANFCGVYALKTTWGQLSLAGHVPPPPGERKTIDLAVPGPMARTAADLRLLQSILCRAPATPRHDIRGRRVAVWLEEPGFKLASEARMAVERAAAVLRAQGADVHMAKPPITGAELIETYRALLRPLMGLSAPDDDIVVAAKATRDGMKRRLGTFFAQGWDAILMPVTPVVAFPHVQQGTMADRLLECDGEEIRYAHMLDWIALATALHMPALAAPAGRTASGLPVGVQLVGQWHGEYALIDYGDALEEEFRFSPPELSGLPDCREVAPLALTR